MLFYISEFFSIVKFTLMRIYMWKLYFLQVELSYWPPFYEVDSMSILIT